MMKKSTYDVSHHSAVCGVTGDYYRISATYHITRSVRVFLIILCCLLSGGAFAGSPINAGFISPDNVNLSTRDFLKFYATDNVQKKDNALMYMLGVADATESKAWCGYGQVDSITINHTVLAWLDRYSVKKPDARASVLIEEALVKNFPCQRTDSSIKIASRSSPILSLTPDALNLSGNDFFKFWVSGNQRDKLRAGVYLLGVEDATEKKLWCGYDLFKTLTLNEIVYVFLKNKTHKELNSRAAELIINKLIEYPCNI